MTTVSVPLSAELMEMIDNLISQGIASNKAELIRMAIKQYAEDQAVQAVLTARKEPSLEGDLNELAKKI